MRGCCLNVDELITDALPQLVNDFGVPIGIASEEKEGSDSSAGGEGGEGVIGAAEIFAFCNQQVFEHRTAAVRKAACEVYVNCHKFIGAEASELLADGLKDRCVFPTFRQRDSRAHVCLALFSMHD